MWSKNRKVDIDFQTFRILGMEWLALFYVCVYVSCMRSTRQHQHIYNSNYSICTLDTDSVCVWMSRNVNRLRVLCGNQTANGCIFFSRMCRGIEMLCQMVTDSDFHCRKFLLVESQSTLIFFPCEPFATFAFSVTSWRAQNLSMMIADIARRLPNEWRHLRFAEFFLPTDSQ